MRNGTIAALDINNNTKIPLQMNVYFYVKNSNLLTALSM